MRPLTRMRCFSEFLLNCPFIVPSSVSQSPAGSLRLASREPATSWPCLTPSLHRAVRVGRAGLIRYQSARDGVASTHWNEQAPRFPAQSAHSLRASLTTSSPVRAVEVSNVGTGTMAAPAVRRTVAEGAATASSLYLQVLMPECACSIGLASSSAPSPGQSGVGRSPWWVTCISPVRCLHLSLASSPRLCPGCGPILHLDLRWPRTPSQLGVLVGTIAERAAVSESCWLAR